MSLVKLFSCSNFTLIDLFDTARFTRETGDRKVIYMSRPTDRLWKGGFIVKELI